MHKLLFIICVLVAFNSKAETYSLIQGKSEVCEAVLRYFNEVEVPVSEFKIEFLDARNNESEENLYKLPDGSELSPLIFDFDNDGKNEQVFIKAYDGHYMWGTKLFVRKESTTQSWSKKQIAIGEVNVYPCQFDKSSPNSDSCPPFSQEADEAGIVFEGTKKVFFRGRYTSLVPISYRGTTYLILESMQKNSAIIKPLPKNKYLSLCLLNKS